MVNADITRGYLYKSLSTSMEFIVESDRDSPSIPRRLYHPCIGRQYHYPRLGTQRMYKLTTVLKPSALATLRGNGMASNDMIRMNRGLGPVCTAISRFLWSRSTSLFKDPTLFLVSRGTIHHPIRFASRQKAHDDEPLTGSGR